MDLELKMIFFEKRKLSLWNVVGKTFFFCLLPIDFSCDNFIPKISSEVLMLMVF